MDFGLTIEKLFLIGVIAALIIGPERLPKAAETFAGVVRKVGEYLRDTRTRMRDEIGPEIDEVDWRKLDPRQYDPRRIIRDALLEDAPSTTATATAVAPAAVPAAVAERQPSRVRPDFTKASPPPFDLEAT
ncbi:MULTISPECIES: Sec-independent protein translocase TatB [unclassified Microbacterium]|uniref:Sec-independent protein translocase TatB n=1 Tax=unclassified Microbacterium TaxID=2609290 RepID=UPI001DFD6181|nr:Sec-independent protein translocase TatB [Microbacterium sp. Bi121]CAH0131304.1 Sec-independent protein translocase protein TatB [Microbacterium sp. Bi121]